MKLSDERDLPHPRGWLSPENMERLAQGLFNEWRDSDASARRAILQQAWAMTPGYERDAAVRFFQMVWAYRERGCV